MNAPWSFAHESSIMNKAFEISINLDMQMTPPLWQNVKRNGYVGELLELQQGLKDPLEVPEFRCD